MLQLSWGSNHYAHFINQESDEVGDFLKINQPVKYVFSLCD